MKHTLTAMLFLLGASVSQSTEYTATVKCDLRAMTTKTYTAKSDGYIDAAKAAIDKIEDDGRYCYSITVTPKAYPMAGCSNRSCPPGYGYNHR